MSIDLFGKQNNKETPQVKYPVPTTTKVVGGGFSVMVEKVDEKKQTVTVAWLDENGEKMRNQTISLADYNGLGNDTVAIEDDKKPVTEEVEVVDKKTIMPDTDTTTPVLRTQKKGGGKANTKAKTDTTPVVKEEIKRVFFGGKDGFLIKKDFIFKTVDTEYNLVNITINTIKRSSNDIELGVTIAGNGKTEVATITANDLKNIIEKSKKNQKALEEIQTTKLTLRDKDGKLQILEKKLEETKVSVVTDEAINLEKALVYEERVSNAIVAGDEDTMALLQQEIFEVREKYGKLLQTEQLVAKLDDLYRTLDNARIETLDTKDATTPLGFSVGETISVFGTLYNVVSYDPAKKRYVLKNEVTKETKDELESSLKFAWSYPIEEKSADTALPVAPEASTDVEAVKDTTTETALQEIDEKIRQSKASIDMLEQSIAQDDALLAQLRAELAEKLLEEANTAGKKIFDDIVASTTTEIVDQGMEGNNYYYDAKDGRGYTIRNYYRFDGTFDGSKTIAEPENSEENNESVEEILKKFPEHVQKIAKEHQNEGSVITSVEDSGSEYALSYTTQGGETEIEFIEKGKESEYIPTHHIEYYLSVPNKDGSFNLSSARKNIVDGASIWQFEILGNDLFAISLPKSESTRKMAVSYVDKTVDPIFETKGFAMDKKIVDIKVIRPAIVQLVGDKFILKEKGDLEYIQ